MLFLLRGIPVVYYGDEQGFIGHGVDQDSRQDMFASQVATYNDQPLLGTASTTATANYDTRHPLYRQIALLSRLRTENPALRRGKQVVRAVGGNPHLLAVSRMGNDGREIVVAFNTSGQPIAAQVEVEAASTAFRSLAGKCADTASAPGSLHVELPPWGFIACAASPMVKMPVEMPPNTHPLPETK
jgi:glycosidase